MKKVVLLSGGMDSTTLITELCYLSGSENVYSLSFDYGQKHDKELYYAKRAAKKLNIIHKVLDLTILNEIAPSALTRDSIIIPEGNYNDESMKSTVVPARNLVLLSLACSYGISIGANEIYYGAHSGDHCIYPDCRPEFIEAVRDVFKVVDYNEIKLIVPYSAMSKTDILSTGLIYDCDYELTWTCYKGGEKACGKCGSCIERLEAFSNLGIKDPIEYE